MRPLPFFVCCGQSARGSCAVPLWDRAEEQAKPGGNFEDARGSDRRAGRQAHVILTFESDGKRHVLDRKLDLDRE